MRAAAALVLSFTFTGCGRSTGPQPAIRVQIAMARSPLTYLPAYLAAPLGYYRDEGLDVSIHEVSGGAKAIEAVIGGSADVAGAFYEHSVQMAAEGRAWKSFVTMLQYPGMAMVVSPKAQQRITRIADLRGAVVGVGTPGSPTHFFLNHLLLSHGLTLRDATVVGIGTPATAAAALEHGRVDAAVVGAAMVLLRERHPDLKVLAETFTAEGVKQHLGVEAYPGATLLAPAEWLRANPDAARRLARAIKRSVQWIRAHSVEQVREKLPEAYRAADAATDLASLRLFIPLLSSDGVLAPESAEGVRRVLAGSLEKVRTAKIRLEETYTNEFVRE